MLAGPDSLPPVRPSLNPAFPSTNDERAKYRFAFLLTRGCPKFARSEPGRSRAPNVPGEEGLPGGRRRGRRALQIDFVAKASWLADNLPIRYRRIS